MNMKTEIQNDLLEARKANDTVLKTLLSVLIGEIQLKESRGDLLDNKGVLKITKKLKKSCDEMAKFGCGVAETESALLDRYIPEAISLEEIECIIISSPLYQEILDSDNPMKLTSRATDLINETGQDFNGKDIATVMRSFKEKK